MPDFTSNYTGAQHNTAIYEVINFLHPYISFMGYLSGLSENIQSALNGKVSLTLDNEISGNNLHTGSNTFTQVIKGSGRLVNTLIDATPAENFSDTTGYDKIIQPVAMPDTPSADITITVDDDMLAKNTAITFKEVGGNLVGSGHDIIIASEGSTIDGQSSITMTSNYESITIVPYDGAWYIE